MRRGTLLNNELYIRQDDIIDFLRETQEQYTEIKYPKEFKLLKGLITVFKNIKY